MYKDSSQENHATQLMLVVHSVRREKIALEVELPDYERLAHATTVKLAVINEILHTFSDALRNINVEG